MADTLATDTASPKALKRVRYALGLAALGVALADWLFYGHPVGISAAIYIVFLAACVTITNPAHMSTRVRLVSIVILAVSALPIVENAGLLSLLSGVAGLCIYTLMTTRALSGDVIDRAFAIVGLVFSGPRRFFADLSKLRQSGAANPIMWVMPIGLGLIFLLLFRFANPLIETWLDQLSPSTAVRSIEFKRLLFWCLTLAVTWSFLRGRVRARLKWRKASDHEERPADGTYAKLLGPSTVLRSLILFNMLFAVQTGLDMAYLWGGLDLPEGMTYAAYAHRGAYPLVIAALLAAGFVLFALRPGSDTERSKLLRVLVYLWIGQTLLLVGSSILRLNLYVEIYSLTYLRTAAFIWMFLVALGLVLIIARIILRQSNEWLISVNTVALAATLYVCAFVNFPYVIAAYNVKHSKEIAGSGTALDTRYLCSLGPQVLPAIEPYIDTLDNRSKSSERLNLLYHGRRFLVRRHRDRMADWRAWTFRDWRLSRYLAKHDEVWTP